MPWGPGLSTHLILSASHTRPSKRSHCQCTQGGYLAASVVACGAVRRWPPPPRAARQLADTDSSLRSQTAFLLGGLCSFYSCFIVNGRTAFLKKIFNISRVASFLKSEPAGGARVLPTEWNRGTALRSGWPVKPRRCNQIHGPASCVPSSCMEFTLQKSPSTL